MLCLFFGMLVFFLGVRKEVDGGKAPWKWAGLIVLGIGSYSVYQDFFAFIGIGEPSYVTYFRDLYAGKKNSLAIIVGFTFPILAMLGCVIANSVIAKRKRANND